MTRIVADVESTLPPSSALIRSAGDPSPTICTWLGSTPFFWRRSRPSTSPGEPGALTA
jgi:hypothetical protein